MTQNYKRGFTLIELLVVIAIIGILAGIVLAALGNTRQKGADAGVQGNLDSIRTQAEVFASSNGNSYTGVCADTTVSNALTAAKNTAGATSINPAIGVAGGPGIVTCHENGTAWGVEAPLKTAGFWCVDSTGFAGTTTSSSLAINDPACR
jgi:prepilin-type N-terminal cleavage/methylation domain-containing protein